MWRCPPWGVSDDGRRRAPGRCDSRGTGIDSHLLFLTTTCSRSPSPPSPLTARSSLAEGLHVSPVIAVLSTGLVIGNYGRQKGMSPPTQLVVNSFWEYAAFVVNSLVFLLVGLEIQVTKLGVRLTIVLGHWCDARGATGCCLFPDSGFQLVRREAGTSMAVGTVLGWVAWSLSIALVLSLPAAVPERTLLVTMIFGSVIFSLLVQGLTIGPLPRWLGFAASERLHRRLSCNLSRRPRNN